MTSALISADSEHSIMPEGILAIDFEIVPTVARFHGNGLRYVQPYLKGRTIFANCEWAIRYHSDDHPDKPMQLCIYAFNRQGGVGAGARCAWPLLFGAVNRCRGILNYIDNEIRLQVNGQWGRSGEGIFRIRGTDIVPQTTDAPVEIGNGFEGLLSLPRFSRIA